MRIQKRWKVKHSTRWPGRWLAYSQWYKQFVRKTLIPVRHGGQTVIVSKYQSLSETP